MQKGQGSLEYLIIVAAVLAIAAIVVLFLTGAFQSQQTSASIAACKTAAGSCANDLATSAGQAKCGSCDTSCPTQFAATCKLGQPQNIFS